MEKRKINSLGLEVYIRVLLPQRDKEDNGKEGDGSLRWFSSRKETCQVAVLIAWA